MSEAEILILLVKAKWMIRFSGALTSFATWLIHLSGRINARAIAITVRVQEQDNA